VSAEDMLDDALDIEERDFRAGQGPHTPFAAPPAANRASDDDHCAAPEVW
jgi:hypothetical protein